MGIKKINIKEKLSLFSDYWNPRIVGELNGQHIKLAKINGEFVWHKHDNEDEMFLVISGSFDMQLRDETIALSVGDFIIIPKGVEHKPVAHKPAEIMLFEPANTVNTGDNNPSDLTRKTLDKI